MNIKELQKWMKEECYNTHSYAIGDEQFVYQGFGLKCVEGCYIWYYTERGQEEIIEVFASEEDACRYAFEQLQNDRFARAHLIGLVESADIKEAICQQLRERKIEFEADRIHYQTGIYKYRIFVFGCDVNRTKDLHLQFTLNS